MQQELWLFTMRFPFGNGETFLENELPVLCKQFERVVLIPLFAEGEARPLPANASVNAVLKEPYRTAGPLTMLRHWAPWKELVHSIRSSAPSVDVFRTQWPTLRSRCRQNLQRAVSARRTLSSSYDPQRVILYSYWTADWATVLGLWRSMDPRVRFVSRMHGFDLYVERHAHNWPPFRAYHLAHTERVLVASQAGLDHLVHHFPQHRSHFELAHLGTHDHGAGPWSPNEELRLVSCANLVPLKRVHLIAEALRHVSTPVRWTHFGDGTERERLEALVAQLPRHIHVELKGQCPNMEVITWYKEHAADLFVHASASEGGVPVALQEAASFGIPLLAADAGGVREIVNERTGTLISPDPDPASLAGYIQQHSTSTHATTMFRHGVRQFWSERFNAEDVYARFCERLRAVLS